MDYFLEADQIYSPKTKEYFQEVLTSYAIGNYRSATVMLYSICICDILYKLEELRDMYNDSIAKNILNDIEKEKNKSKSNSSWEKELIEKTHKQTELLDNESYSNIISLYADRNLSAHPALNGSLDLIKPSREKVASYIRIMLDSLLLKPSFFAKNIIEVMTSDLDGKKDYILKNKIVFSTYMKNRYFLKLSDNKFITVYRTLWKFAFLLTDEKCEANREINISVVELMYNDRKNIILSEIRNNPSIYEVKNSDLINAQLVLFLSRNSQIYNELAGNVKECIHSMIDGKELKLIAWFTSNKKSHLATLSELTSYHFTLKYINYFYDAYVAEGLKDQCLDFISKTPHKTYSFDEANCCYHWWLLPRLPEMNESHLRNILDAFDSNGQYFRSMYFSKYCAKIKSCLPENFDYGNYTKIT